MSDLDVKLKTKQVSGHLVSIAVAKDNLLINVIEMANREVDQTPSCESMTSFVDVPRFYGHKRTTRCFAETPS
jgi:hypothetical protein